MRGSAAFVTVALVLSSLVLSSGCTSGTGDRPAAVPAPLAPGSDDVIAYIVVPGLDAALKDVAGIAGTVTPDPTKAPTPDQLKTQVGVLLGDPGLANLDGSRPLLVAVLRAQPAQPAQPMPTVPPLVGLFPAKQAAPFDQHLAAIGMQSRFADGLLAVAQTPDALAAASKVRGLYDRLATAKLDTTARLYLDTGAALELYGQFLKASVAQLTSLFGNLGGGGPGATGEGSMQGLARILKLEALALLALLEQLDQLQLDLDLGPAGIGGDTVAVAKTGSPLAEFFSKSKALRPPTTSVLEGGDGLATVSYVFDPDSFGTLLQTVINEVSKDPDSASFFTPEFTRLFTDIGSWWKGTGVMIMRASERTIAMDYVMDVTDGQKYLEVMEKTTALMAPGSAFAEAYRQLGMEFSLSLQRDAREHAGVPVHHWKMSMKMPDAPAGTPFDSGFMAGMMNQEAGLAVVGGRGLMSYNSLALDRMIDAAKAGKTGSALKLESRSIFGAGRHAYVDYDIVGLMKAIFLAMPEGQPGAEALEALADWPSARPMVMAITFDTGRAQLQGRMPVDFIGGFASLRAQAAPPAELPPEDRIERDLRNYEIAAELYFVENGSFPETLEQLDSFKLPDDMPDALRIRSKLDPWGRPYGYRRGDRKPVFFTLGRDGVEGGEGEDADHFWPEPE